MSDTLQEPRLRVRDVPFAVHLELRVEDRDVITELEKYGEGQEREEFALEALKIGVLTLRRASSALDGELLQREMAHMLQSLQEQLNSHTELAKSHLEGSLKNYFDPDSGHFSRRVQSLTATDGDLAKVIGGFIDGDQSRLTKTLLSHVGETSPLMKHLSPGQSEGLIELIRTKVESQLALQRDRLLSEFSLDNADGSLRRLINELTTKHGDLSTALQNKIDALVKEFSLNEENSALSRLCKNVDEAQTTITKEFSLDNEGSALRRLKSELMTVLEAHVKTNVEFQEDVKVALAKLVTKREVEARGTQHGGVFEQAVFSLLDHDAQRRGDVAEFTGGSVGAKKHCKIGDVVIHLGPECAAPGAKIVVEAKEEAKYSLRAAREEIEEARNNRDAQHGVFVFSKKTAPTMEPLVRYGTDVVVVWDAEDPTTDCYLRAAVEIARALCVRCQQSTDRQRIDFAPIDQAINEVEKKAANLGDIENWTTTIQNNSTKIIERLRIDRQALDKQVLTLREAMTGVKLALADEDSPAH